MHRIIFWICSQNNNYYFRPQFDLSLYLDLVHVFDKSKHYLSQLAKEFQFFFYVGHKPKCIEIDFYMKKKIIIED